MDNKCSLCDNIRNLSYLYNHENEEMIFSYEIKDRGYVYKHYKNNRYIDIIHCPNCGRLLKYQ